MILNFEADVNEVLYDCDADVSGDGTVKLIEVRVVGPDGETLETVPIEGLPGNVVTELMIQATSERQQQIEIAEERERTR